MRRLVDSSWRAVAYCLHPKVVALSVLPLVLMVAASFLLGYLFWDAAVSAMLRWLEGWAPFAWAMQWMTTLGLPEVKPLLAPLFVLVLVTPLIVLLALLLVALLMTPAIVDLVAQRRFPDLQRLRGGSFWRSVAWSLWSTVLALLALVASIPLWLIPPLVLILPPLIWGWLTYRVFAFDALAEHASVAERRELFEQHRWVLLGMGVLCGYLGAAPSLLWASGAVFVALAPLLVPLAVWIYALVFAFAALWFTHYLLAALEDLRRQRQAAEAVAPPPEPEPPRAVPGEVIDVTAKEIP
jgi:hypothetical protein